MTGCVNYLGDDSSSDDLILETLKRDVREKPNKVAIKDFDRKVSYRELDILSDKVAGALKDLKGEYVLVNYPHTIDLVILVYGIYKAGKVYVPVDYYAPQAEREAILSNFEDKIYISDDGTSNLDLKQAYSRDRESLDYEPGKLAYIIHTSGTTGSPKGVMVTRKNLENFLRGYWKIVDPREDSVFLFSTRNTFDVSISELFGFLKNGASAFVYPIKDQKFFKILPDVVEDNSITDIAMSPSGLRVLLKTTGDSGMEKLNAKVRNYCIAGEDFKIELIDLINRKIKNSRVFNFYGPTEATVYASSYQVTGRERDFVPIGQAMEGVSTLVRGEDLYLGGGGLAEGYYKKPDLTRKKFLDIGDKRYYATGDLVFYDGDNLVYKGRADDQVQLSGIRVELNDVLNNIKKVLDPDDERDLEVLYYEDSLVLFYTGKKISNIREVLKGRISSYKIPTRFINLEKIPLNRSGKKDKKFLLNYLKDSAKAKVTKKSEDNILDIIRREVYSCLGEIEDTDPIYERGLDSLGCVELILSLEKALDFNFGEKTIYDLESIRGIYDFVANKVGEGTGGENCPSQDLELKNSHILTRDDKILKDFPLYYYARIYHTLNFNSIIYDKIDLTGKDLTYEEIIHTLYGFEVLRSFVNLDRGVFEERDVPINISKIYVKDLNIDLREDLEELVIENRRAGTYLYKIVYAYNEGGSKLFFAFDHSIFDQSCTDVFKRLVLSGKRPLSNYSDFIEMVRRFNTRERMEKALAMYDFDSSPVEEALMAREDSYELAELSYLSAEPSKIYMEALAYLRDNFLRPKEISKAKINLIYNFRKFKDLDFSDVIGDLHTGLIYLYEEGKDLGRSLEETVDYYKKTSFMPKYYGYRNFPNLSEEDRNFVRVFDDETLISLNYLGIISKVDLEKLKETYLNGKREVDKLNSNKLNATLYIMDDKVYMFLSKRI